MIDGIQHRNACASEGWTSRRISALVFDIDGTLDTGIKGDIHPPTVRRMAEWSMRGANLFIVTNRPATWVWSNVLISMLEHIRGVPEGRIFAACEQGALIMELVIRDDSVRWVAMKSWPIPDRKAVENAVQSAIDAGYLTGRLRRGLQFQVCVEGLSGSVQDVSKWLPYAMHRKLRIRRTRSTLTLYDPKAGKDCAVRYLQQEHPELWRDICLGFGDDGDEFGLIIPVLDVDKDRRDLFRRNELNGVPVYLPDALARLGLPNLKLNVTRTAEVAKGAGFATAAILEALADAIESDGSADGRPQSRHQRSVPQLHWLRVRQNQNLQR